MEKVGNGNWEKTSKVGKGGNGMWEKEGKQEK